MTENRICILSDVAELCMYVPENGKMWEGRTERGADLLGSQKSWWIQCSWQVTYKEYCYVRNTTV